MNDDFYIILWSGGYERPAVSVQAERLDADEVARQWAVESIEDEGDRVDVVRVFLNDEGHFVTEHVVTL